MLEVELFILLLLGSRGTPRHVQRVVGAEVAERPEVVVGERRDGGAHGEGRLWGRHKAVVSRVAVFSQLAVSLLLLSEEVVSCGFVAVVEVFVQI